MSNYVFGVDIGGTTVKMGLFDKEGTLLDKWEIPSVTANHGERILPDIADSTKPSTYQVFTYTDRWVTYMEMCPRAGQEQDSQRLHHASQKARNLKGINCLLLKFPI